MMIRLSAVLLFALTLFVSPSNGAPMDARETQAKVVERLRAHADVASVTIVEDGLLSVLLTGETEPRIVNLRQIDLLMLNAGYTDTILDDFVAGIIAPKDVLEATPSISTALPVVRSKETFDGFDQLAATWEKPTMLIRYPLAVDIEAGFVFRTPYGKRYATEADLVSLNISKDNFAEAALRNFDAMTRETQWSRSGNGLIATMDGNYESSLILLDDLWPEIEKMLGGSIVVGVPARDSLVVVRADDAAKLADLRTAMNNEYAYPISSKLLTRKNGRWVQFE